MKPVKEMKQLQLLSYSTDEGNDDSTIAVLKTGLPNTIVVPNDGFCVGSGWLLLLLPGMLLAVLLAKNTSKRTNTLPEQ
jgi:membrane protein YqaA with SNARE-associated domain